MANYYPYKTKLDGSKSSIICLRCFRTIGAASNDLARSEQDHICDPQDLQLLDRRQTSADGHVIEFSRSNKETHPVDQQDNH